MDCSNCFKELAVSALAWITMSTFVVYHAAEISYRIHSIGGHKPLSAEVSNLAIHIIVLGALLGSSMSVLVGWNALARKGLEKATSSLCKSTLM